MILPNAHLARVEPDKVTAYLLDARHRSGGSKAQFFSGFGFQLGQWRILAEELLSHARHEVTNVKNTPFGPRYEVEGPIKAPDGRTPQIRTVWQMDAGEIAPRLITAYPVAREHL